MAAFIEPNELTASKRTIDVIVSSTVDGSSCPPGTDLTGRMFISQSSSDYIAATGTLTQKKRAVASSTSLEIEATDTTANTVTVTGHGYRTGAGPWLPDTTGGGLDDATDVYLIVVDFDTLAFATSEANAYAGTKIDLSADVTGVEIVADATTKEPIPGHYTYTLTQTETDYTGSDGAFLIDKAQAAEDEHGWYGYATFTVRAMPKGFADASGEGSREWGDLLILCARTLAAKFTKTGNDYQYRDLDDTKDSHHGTVTSAGRTAAGEDNVP